MRIQFIFATPLSTGGGGAGAGENRKNGEKCEQNGNCDNDGRPVCWYSKQYLGSWPPDFRSSIHTKDTQKNMNKFVIIYESLRGSSLIFFLIK